MDQPTPRKRQFDGRKFNLRRRQSGSIMRHMSHGRNPTSFAKARRTGRNHERKRYGPMRVTISNQPIAKADGVMIFGAASRARLSSESDFVRVEFFSDIAR